MDDLIRFIVLWLGLCCFGALMLAGKWMFSQKIGQTIPFLVLFMATAFVIKARTWFPGAFSGFEACWRTGWCSYFVAGLGLLTLGVLVLTTYWWYHSRDSYRLME